MDRGSNVLLLVDVNDRLLEENTWETVAAGITSRLKLGQSTQNVSGHDMVIAWSTTESRFSDQIMRHKRAVIGKGSTVDWVKLRQLCGHRTMPLLTCMRHALDDVSARGSGRRITVVIVTDGTNPLPETCKWADIVLDAHHALMVAHVGPGLVSSAMHRLVSNDKRANMMRCLADGSSCLIPSPVMPRLIPLPPIEHPRRIATRPLAPESFQDRVSPDFTCVPVDGAQRAKLVAFSNRIKEATGLVIQQGELQKAGATTLYIFGNDRHLVPDVLNSVLRENM